MSDLSLLLDAVDLATARSEGVLPGNQVADLQAIAGRIRTRHGYLGEALVVAFAGGTGSGKSSLLNAVVGDDIAATGVVRPTTQGATAVFGVIERVDLTRLLDDLDVELRVEHEGLGRLVIVDLPDFDSIREAHRRVVEEVLPRVDVVIWVLDPEKYADPVLHDEFLRRLVPYEKQFGFVVNKADRIPGNVDLVTESLTAKLVEDGYADPHVESSIGVEIDGLPVDISGLEALIERSSDTKRTAARKIALDARNVAMEGWKSCMDVDQRNLGQQSLDRLALASATFVSLGVEAYSAYAID